MLIFLSALAPYEGQVCTAKKTLSGHRFLCCVDVIAVRDVGGILYNIIYNIIALTASFNVADTRAGHAAQSPLTLAIFH